MINILLIASIFGFTLSTILFLKKSTNTRATVLLGGFYFLLSVYAFQAYIIDGGHLDKAPWFFLWPLIPYNAIFVPIYFYFQIIFKDKLEWKKRYFILFIPFVLGLIDVGYVYLQPDGMYERILNAAIANPKTRLGADYWLLSLNEHLLLRHVWQLGVLLVLLPPLLKFIKKGKGDKLKAILNKWLLFFWIILMFMAIFAILYAIEKMGIMNIYYPFLNSSPSGGTITLILYLAILSIGIVPIYFPSILYGYPQSNKIIQVPGKDDEGSCGLKFGLEESEMKIKLDLLHQNKCYLDQNFNLTLCAREMDLPAHHLSYFLKERYGLSFTAYKNNLRMEYAKTLIQTGFLKNNTVEALALECGFAGRTSFSKAFKKAEGINPTEYFQKVYEPA